MKTIKGTFAEAKVFTTKKNNPIDQYAEAQIKMICDQKSSEGRKIAIMPDVHPGKVGPIGLTMALGEKIKAVMPNLIGSDIGCGMTVGKVKAKRVEGKKLDAVIRECIPSGFDIRKTPHNIASRFDYDVLSCSKHVNIDKAKRSIGTLGGGNHFIEIDKDDDGYIYIVIHSGSRHLGKEVTDYYLKKGQEILKQQGVEVPYELTYLEDELCGEYLGDIIKTKYYASLNRDAILHEILKGMKWKLVDKYESVHNYIDMDAQTLSDCGGPVVRKGAVSAKLGEKVIIPINMKDGVIIATGLGNIEWNCSAPHGSGRIIKRGDVKDYYTVSAFKSAMKDIYSTCIDKSTLDEAPFVYRSLDEILEVINDTVRVNMVIKPIYSFKAGNNLGLVRI